MGIGALEGKGADAAQAGGAILPAGSEGGRLPWDAPAPGRLVHYRGDILVDVAEMHDGQLVSRRQRQLRVRKPNNASGWLSVPDPGLGSQQGQRRVTGAAHEDSPRGPNLNRVSERGACR